MTKNDITKKSPIRAIDDEELEVLREWVDANAVEAQEIAAAFTEAVAYSRLITQAVQGIGATNETNQLDGLFLISNQFIGWLAEREAGIVAHHMTNAIQYQGILSQSIGSENDSEEKDSLH